MVTLRRNEEDLFPPGRNSLALFLLLLAVFSGVTFLYRVILGQSGSLAAVLPLPIEISWNLLLFGGAAIAFIGGFLRDPLTGRLLERAGLIALGAAAIAYGLAILGVTFIENRTGGGVTNGITIIVFGAFVLSRVRQIKKELEFFSSKAPSAVTIYSLFGGRAGLESIVHLFYDRVRADPIIGHYFQDKDVDRIRNNLVDVLSSITGGPQTGSMDIVEIHEGLGITDSDFTRLLNILENTMKEKQIETPLIEWMIRRLELYRADVVEQNLEGGEL